MALRAFRCNPAIGGFGNETAGISLSIPAASAAPPSNVKGAGGNSSSRSRASGNTNGNTSGNTSGSSNANTTDTFTSHSHSQSQSQEACDAFAQILKELVDNAVDACTNDFKETSTNTSTITSNTGDNYDEEMETMKRVRVRIETQECAIPIPIPQAGNKNGDKNDNDKRREILRVKVCDNGCGMEDIQKCVSAFSTSKADRTTNNTTTPKSSKHGGNSSPQGVGDDNNDDETTKQTAGRYGIGLTLCILHSQRLVPGSCTMIRSAVKSSSYWTEARFVVDTDQDAVVCIKKERIPKRQNDKRSCGTEVNLLVPGGIAAKKAWPRLAEYLSRFQLSLGMKCSLEVMAPSLSRIPLYVRPPYEVERRKQKRERQLLQLQLLQQQQQQQRELLEQEQRRLEEERMQSSSQDPNHHHHHDHGLMNNDNITQGNKDDDSDSEESKEKDFCDFFDIEFSDITTMGKIPNRSSSIYNNTTIDKPSNDDDDDDDDGIEREQEFDDECHDLEGVFLSSCPMEEEEEEAKKQSAQVSSPPPPPPQPQRSKLKPKPKPPRKKKQETKKATTKRQQREENMKRRIQIKDAVELYLKKPIELANVAHSIQKIRRPGGGGAVVPPVPAVANNITSTSTSGNGKSSSSCATDGGSGGPTLEIDIIVSKHDADDGYMSASGAEEDDNDNEYFHENDENLPPSTHLKAMAMDPTNDVATRTSNVDQSKAKIVLIRMVNRIPLLDGVEASACGIVRGLLQKQLWNSFGLDISHDMEDTSTCSLTTEKHTSKKKASHNYHQGGVVPNNNATTRLYVPTFSLGDSAHVAPFFTHNRTHNLFDDGNDKVSSDDESDNDGECGSIVGSYDYVHNMEGTKRKRKKKMCLKPAGLRLGNVLIIVQLNAKSSQLPLPTLSKGRLPMNDAAIDTALQAGLNACLRSLQETNPSLLLTPSQLKKTERDVLYVPSIASAFAAMTFNCQDSELRNEMILNIQRWHSNSSLGRHEDENGGNGSYHHDLAYPSAAAATTESSYAISAKDDQQIQKELCIQIEERIHQALTFREEERKLNASKKSKAKRQASKSTPKSAKKKTKQDDDIHARREEQSSTASSSASSNCDLHEFLSQSQNANATMILSQRRTEEDSLSNQNETDYDECRDIDSIISWNEGANSSNGNGNDNDNDNDDNNSKLHLQQQYDVDEDDFVDDWL